MTGDLGTWLLATWMIVTALGLVAFWLTWFRVPHTAQWQPAGYVEHERVFVFPDSTLALLLLVSAVLLLLGEPLGRSLALLDAGMLAFLGIIDAAYFTQHGMFARQREGLLNATLVGSVLSLATVLAIRYA